MCRKLRSHHALAIPLAFDNIEIGRNMVGPGPEPQQVADQMRAAWIAFARTGNPNNDKLPQWPAYDLDCRATMIFNVRSQVQINPYGEIRRILMRFEKLAADANEGSLASA